MASTYTPSNIDLTNDREWGHALAMLDWDTTNIVFTKRTLLDFLKLQGVTVDQNFSNISKLPKYAKFGKITAGAPPAAASHAVAPDTVAASTSDADPEENEQVGLSFASEVKPSRRVRTNPGGTSSMGNLWDEDTQDEFKPTRRVREIPGGSDHINGLF